MDEVVITGRILEWGNSYGIRIKKADLERVGLKPGAEAVIRIQNPPDKIDLSHVTFLTGGSPDDSARHDELLGEHRLKTLHGHSDEDR